MPTKGPTVCTNQRTSAPVVYEVEPLIVRTFGQGSSPETRIGFQLPEEARARLRNTTQSAYWAQIALGLPILSAPAPFALICFDTDADRYPRFEKARKERGLGRAKFGFYPYQVDDAPDPAKPRSRPLIGLVDFMTIGALQRAQELLPDFAPIDVSMLDADAHYLIFLLGCGAAKEQTPVSRQQSGARKFEGPERKTSQRDEV